MTRKDDDQRREAAYRAGEYFQGRRMQDVGDSEWQAVFQKELLIIKERDNVLNDGLGVGEDICGLCGQPGADKMALWTGGGVWP